MPGLEQSNRSWMAAIALLLALAAWVGSAQMRDLPLEDHEIFVVETAQEMHARGDWIVPYFNDEPRLTKPPLNYWATGLAAWLSGSLDHIRPWHGRLPSVLAGLGLVGLALFLGARLFDRTTALIAASIVATSPGFFLYTHNARPELLYSFWCTAGLACFAAAWQAPAASRRQRQAAYGLWLSFALATLTKGPQLPLMLLVAFALFLGLEGQFRRQAAAIFRPLGGSALFLALTLPWWWAVHSRLGGAGLHDTQLSGQLLLPDAGSIDAYYLYRPLQAVLPWLVLLPGVFLVLRRPPRPAPVRLLVLGIGVPAVLLAFGPQQRWFYMLPTLVPMCLLLALSARHMFQSVRVARRPWLLCLLPGHGLAAAAALLWLLPGAGPEYPAVVGGLILITGILLWSLAYLPLRREKPLLDMAALAAVFAITIVSLVPLRQLWGFERYAGLQLVKAVAAQVPAAAPLGIWDGLNPGSLVYYGQRRVARIPDPETLEAALDRAPGRQLFLIAREQDVAGLAAQVPARWERLFATGGGGSLALVHLSRLPP